MDKMHNRKGAFSFDKALGAKRMLPICTGYKLPPASSRSYFFWIWRYKHHGARNPKLWRNIREFFFGQTPLCRSDISRGLNKGAKLPVGDLSKINIEVCNDPDSSGSFIGIVAVITKRELPPVNIHSITNVGLS